MQPETHDHIPTTSIRGKSQRTPSPTLQHGLQELNHTSPASADYGSLDGLINPSVQSDTHPWMGSTPSAQNLSGAEESRLSPTEALSPTSESSVSDRLTWENFSEAGLPGPRFQVIKRITTYLDERSRLLEFPEEILLHVLSHLSASDMLTIKLVSRRFCDLVNSPHAWIDAFSRYFPGPELLKASGDITDVDEDHILRRSDRPLFTRIRPKPTWAGEYLARMQLLRCLARGRPGHAVVSPATGRSAKGSGIATFNSHLHLGISHLHANFGHPLDRRLPQFLHGVSQTGAVSSSDRYGKLDPWGTPNDGAFRHFAVSHPEHAMWGLGAGQLVGIPNVMDLSALHGMVYGEGTPDGCTFFLSVDKAWGRSLDSFTGFSDNRFGIPAVLGDEQSTTSVWIAKSTAIPQMTGGLIGILSGSSCGAVTAYSLGTTGVHDLKYGRGEMTARWMISPGVPIIAIAVDDCFSSERHDKRRVWAVLLNALGEIFYLDQIPTKRRQFDLNMSLDYFSETERREFQVWATGRSVKWTLIPGTARKLHPNPYSAVNLHPEPSGWTESIKCWDNIALKTWLSKSPSDIREEFSGWDMRRRLEVDFSSDGVDGSGESVFSIDCGIGEDQIPAIKRYSRLKVSDDVKLSNAEAFEEEQNTTTEQVTSILGTAAWSFHRKSEDDLESLAPYSEVCHSFDVHENSDYTWYCSRFSLSKNRNVVITTTSLDLSKYALTTASEDITNHNNVIQDLRNPDNSPLNFDAYSPFRIPGQRARFLGAGTGSGTIFLWNARAPRPSSINAFGSIKPLRIIHTDSPQITSLAISALYVVHGGSEGLVQAWDPLASTISPIRTLTSRSTLNARRRAVIAAQSNPNGENAFANSLAAGAICLDPDPAVLRGVVAVGSYLRYWSFSSAVANSDMSKSQKKRMRRSDRGLSSPASDSIVRRVGLKGLIAEEVLERQIEEKEKKISEQEDRRIAARFGLDLFGAETSEEQMIAYAQMVSAEDYKNRQFNAKDEMPDQEYREKWKYASWEERFEMSASGSTTKVQTSASATPAADQMSPEDDFAGALRQGLENGRSTSSSRFEEASSSPDDDADLARAIKASLEDTTADSSPQLPGRSTQAFDSDEMLATALSLSLIDAQHLPSSPGSSPEGPRIKQSSWPNAVDDEFPVLGSNSLGVEQSSRRASSKGKGRARQMGKPC